ncbi:hypothetical protein [Brevibacterium zhoupengii]|uniref:hypothetical protein n=1 Tax=Brevibacterium zhoupengii TaxID=2898795 RepID=UPI001F093CE2|nr:hypothetical protein [Brevibacterium zhoupengii]
MEVVLFVLGFAISTFMVPAGSPAGYRASPAARSVRSSTTGSAVVSREAHAPSPGHPRPGAHRARGQNAGDNGGLATGDSENFYSLGVQTWSPSMAKWASNGTGVRYSKINCLRADEVTKCTLTGGKTSWDRNYPQQSYCPTSATTVEISGNRLQDSGACGD